MVLTDKRRCLNEQTNREGSVLTDMLILKKSNCDVTFLRNAITAILLKTEEKHNNNNCSQNNYKKRQKIELVVRNCQKSLRVVTIVPLQSLLSNSRERGRVLGRRVQPSGKK